MHRDAAESVRQFSEAARSVIWAFQAPVRIEILLHLMESPCDVGTLAGQLDLAVTHVSNHLRALLETGMVTMQVQQRRHVYAAGAGVQVEVERSTDLGHDDRTNMRARVWLCIRVPAAAGAGSKANRDRVTSDRVYQADVSNGPEFRIELSSEMAAAVAPTSSQAASLELKPAEMPGRHAAGHGESHSGATDRTDEPLAVPTEAPSMRAWRGTEAGTGKSSRAASAASPRAAAPARTRRAR